MEKENIQTSQNLIIIKGNRADLEAFKSKIYYDNEHFFWEQNLIPNLVYDKDDLEKIFGVISLESEKELHYYVKCIRREDLDITNVALQFSELEFSQVMIQSKDELIKYIEYLKYCPGIDLELKIPCDFMNLQQSFSNFSIANIEEIYLKICFILESKSFIFEKSQHQSFDFYSLISRKNYVNKYRDNLLTFLESEQNIKNKLPDFICERPSPIKINSIYDLVKFYNETLENQELAKASIIDLFKTTVENQSILTYNECKAVNYAYQYLNIEQKILDFSKMYIEIQIQKADYYIKNNDDYCKLLSEYEGLIPEFMGFDDYYIKDYVTKYLWLSSDMTNKYFEKISQIPIIDVVEEAILFQERFFEVLQESRKDAKIFVDKRWELMKKIEKNLIKCGSNFEFKTDFKISSSIILNPYFFDNQLLKIVSHRYKFPFLNDDDDSENQLF
ncbi:MAG: hypothetical protein WCP69_09605 [Bacteroidota bacterium]